MSKGGRSVVLSGLRTIAQNGAVLGASSLADAALRAIYMIAAARLLPLEHYGIWAYAGATLGFALAISGFGLQGLLATRLGGFHNRDLEARAQFVRMTLVIQFGLLAVGMLGLVAYGVFAEPLARAQIALFLLVPALFGRGLAIWAQSCFTGVERPAVIAKRAVVWRITETVLGVGLLSAGGGLEGLIALHSIIRCAEGAMAIRLAHREVAAIRLSSLLPDIDWAEAKGFLHSVTGLGVAGVFLTCLTMSPLILLRQAGVDLEVIGQVGIALNLMMIAGSATLAALSATMPVLARQDSEKGVPKAFPIMVAGLGLTFAAAGYFFGMRFGEVVITLLFGSAFAPAGQMLGLALLIAGLMIMPQGFSQILVLRNRVWAITFANGVGAILFVLMLPFALARWEAGGALAALAVAWGLRAAILAIVSARTLGPGR